MSEQSHCSTISSSTTGNQGDAYVSVFRLPNVILGYYNNIKNMKRRGERNSQKCCLPVLRSDSEILGKTRTKGSYDSHNYDQSAKTGIIVLNPRHGLLLLSAAAGYSRPWYCLDPRTIDPGRCRGNAPDLIEWETCRKDPPSPSDLVFCDPI